VAQHVAALRSVCWALPSDHVTIGCTVADAALSTSEVVLVSLLAERVFAVYSRKAWQVGPLPCHVIASTGTLAGDTELGRVGSDCDLALLAAHTL
jgi:ADP-ribose pyrophosphatase YjhB (NUDIX family)